MSLYSDVYDGSAGTRIPTHKLAALTNPNDESGTATPNATVLALACTDAEAQFKIEAQETYSSSTAWHPRLGARLLLILLKNANSELEGSKYDEEMKSWRESAKIARSTSKRAPMRVVTTSELTVPQENTTGGDLPPSMDGIFDDVTPEKP